MEADNSKFSSIQAGLFEVLETHITKCIKEFLGSQVQSVIDCTEGYLDLENRLTLPAGIYSQMGFGNALAEGALILQANPEQFHRVSPHILEQGNVRLSVDVLGELSNLLGGGILNERLLKDPYDTFSLAPPIKFENNGGVRYFENSQGINLVIKVLVEGEELIFATLLKERRPFYADLPSSDCEEID